MICFIPDTNILLNALKGNYDDHYFLSILQNVVANKKMVFAVPEQVMVKWKRHVENISDSTKASLTNTVIQAQRLQLFVLPATLEKYKEIMSKVESEIEKMVTFRIQRKVTALDEILNKYAVIIPTKDEYKLKASDWALEKMPPFLEGKI